MIQRREHVCTIGRRHGVGPGTVGNIRINLGMDAIKPDRHVIGVVQQNLGRKSLPITDYDLLAQELRVPRRYFDEIAFRYGKQMGISAGGDLKQTCRANPRSAPQGRRGAGHNFP